MVRHKTAQAIEHRLFPVGGLQLRLATAVSDRRSLLLLHGIGMDWRVWQASIRRLTPYFSVYAVDLRGHGQSDKPPRGYSLAHYAADIEDLLDRLKCDPVVLIGSSLGGMVAAAVEAPTDVVSHRVLVDPPLSGGPIRDADMFQRILQLKHEPVERLVDFLEPYNPGAGRYYLRAMSEMWHEAADGVIAEMLAHPLDYYAIDSALEAIDCPTLLLQADPTRGGVLSDDQAERARRLLVKGTLTPVQGAGHAIHASVPHQFTRLVLEFTGGQSDQREITAASGD